MDSIARLRDEIAGSGLLTAPQVGDGFVFGTAR
ncbi:cytochrome C5, partial [Rhodococcus hoagii]|nr:cytochrome C5 [Prescottella equi]